MTEKMQSDQLASENESHALEDERLAAMISAYLDGELTGTDLEEFEALLQSDGALAREIEDLRRIERELTKLGSDILSEPIPDSLLEPLSRLSRD
ncbi:MAG: zf-HC2 domain-containing protein [Rhodomicrobium sp.]